MVIQVGFRAWATYTMNNNLGEHSAYFYIYQIMILILDVKELQGTADDKRYPVMSKNTRSLGGICSFIFRIHFKRIYFSFSLAQNSSAKLRYKKQN